MTKGAEIMCPGCGKASLVLRKPRYEGFTRVGEEISCAACGHVFESEKNLQYVQREKVAVFSDEDRSPDHQVFSEDEARTCRHCRHYVVNPFTQWCGEHRREVDATDSCPSFLRREEENPPAI